MDNDSLNTLITNLDSVHDDSIPPWALVLLQSMKGVINGLKVIDELVQRVTKLEDFKRVSETITTQLQDENKRLHDAINKLEMRVDDQEQRSRNMCLLIHGVQESDDENTDELALAIINNDIGLNNTNINEIQRSHRLGPKKQQRNLRSNKTSNRPIIVRFTNYSTRRMVFKAKRNLKGKNISLSENLTQSRYNLYLSAINKFGKGKVWTNEGRITTKVNDRYVTINSVKDLE